MYDEKARNIINRSGSNKSILTEDIYLPEKILTKRDLFIARFIERVDINNLKQHLRRIVKVRNPETALENLNETSQYINSVLKNYNLITKMETFSFRKVKNVLFNNVIAYKKGIDKKRILILSSHYDTVKTSPGADDNASSVACLLEIARLASVLDLEYTIQFVFFTLEEYNMLGSIYHVKNSRNPIDRNIIGVIVLDGIAYTDNTPYSQKQFRKISYPKSSVGDFLSVITNEKSVALLKILNYNINKFLPDFKIEPLIVNDNGKAAPDSRRSDHTSFWDYGFKSIFLTDTAQFRNPNNHQPTDTIDTLDLNFLYNTTKVTLATVLDMCLQR